MKALNRKLLRDLWHARGQAVAVSAVILCGVASFVTVLSAFRGLTLTRDTYYRDYRMADFWVRLEKAPLSAVRKVEQAPGVDRAQGRIVEDVNVDVPGKPEARTGRLISLPPRRGAAINDICLVSGRWFGAKTTNEVIVNDRFARENSLTVGDRIEATMNDRKQPLRIIGTALSPEYVYMIRGAREFMPNPERFGILWVSKDFAEMALGRQQACNEVVGFLTPTADPDAVLDRVERLLEPYGAVTPLQRKDQLSNRYLSDEIKGLGVSARIVPAIFLGIAAMILMVMLGRIVQRDRTEIGVLKAYGYSNLAIGAHYVKFALTIAVAGAAGGVLLGNWLSLGMMRMYVTFFQFPVLRYRFYGDVFLLAMGISVVAGAAGALWAVGRVVRIDPAQAMRPASPRAGHRLWLERCGFLWRRISFIGKMIARNVFRYKLRAALTLLGVVVSTAILMLGHFTTDSMDFLVDYQFHRLQRQDLRVAFHTERGKGAFLEAQRFPWVRRAEAEFSYPFTLRNGWRKKDVVIVGVAPNGRLLNLETVAGAPIDVGGEGLVLDSSLAATLRLKLGDAVVLKPLLGKVRRESVVRVRAVVQQYLGSGAYMNIRALSRRLDEPYAVNAALLAVERGRVADLSAWLKDVPAVAAADNTAQSQQQFEETLAAAMNANNVIFSLFAGVIAFAIIYNSTIISLTERTRELASLRVLGFTLGEVRRIVLGENALLAAVGVVLGLPVGALLCRWLVAAYDTDVYRLPFYLSRRTFVVSALSIGVFTALANLAARRRVARLDMVEVLKQRE